MKRQTTMLAWSYTCEYQDLDLGNFPVSISLTNLHSLFLCTLFTYETNKLLVWQKCRTTNF